MKKLISVILCLITLLAFTSLSCANEKTNLILEYSGDTLKLGETITAKFIINNNSGFGCVTVEIGFNNNNLELKEVKKTYKPTGNYLNIHTDSIISNANQQGNYVLGYMPNVLSSGKFTDPITHNGVFAELTFIAKKDCIAEIGFVNNKTSLFLDDATMTDVPYSLEVKKIKSKENASSSSNSAINNTSSSAANSVSSFTQSNIAENSNITSNSETQQTQSTKPTIQNNINNNNNEKPNNNNKILLISVLAVAFILIAAAFLIKKFNKKQ